DGVRLWVDNQLLIDKWIVQGGVEWTGNLALTAYRKYDIKMEYYENLGAASAQLLWSSPTTAKSIIPQTQLYSGASPVLPFRFASSEWLTNNQFRATFTGAPGEIHRLEVSSNLVNWTLLTILTNVNGTLMFTDKLTNNFPQRFYRMKAGGIYPADIIVDNSTAGVIGAWSTGTTSMDKYGADYRFKSPGTGAAYLQFAPNISLAGNYQVYEWHPQGVNRTTAASYVIEFNGGAQTNSVNQQINGGQWNLLGTFNFAVGTAGGIKISDDFSVGSVVLADAIKFVYAP
ncbi:MAG: PA14 domain-containing protein, partial [Verrucomicrobiota bacterium]|nr:PA14 domain-containing protein [Verrucomicrobiota bacterium]